MKKQTLLILLLLLPFISNAQWYYLNSDCSYDYVKSTQNSDSQKSYMKFKISFGSNDLKEKYYANQLSFLAEMRIFYTNSEENNCPWDDNSDGITNFIGEKSTVSVKLMKDNIIADVIVDNKVFSEGEDRDLLRDIIKNYKSTPIDTQLGGGYSLLFSLRIEDHTDYYDFFDKTVTAKSSEFTLGKGSEVIYPEINAEINTLTPTIKWKELNNTTDYRMVIYKITDPATFSWSSSTGIINGAIYDSDFMNSLEKEIPNNILEHNAEYGILIINRINGFLFGKTSTFKTGDALSIVDYEFQNQISVSPNPSSEKVTISSEKDLRINKVAVFDVNGRLVKKYNKNSFKRINISNLNKGVYFLKIVNIENKQAIFRIVKN